MPIVELERALLRHTRLAALATSARPAWLWSADASQMLWVNPVGAALFGPNHDRFGAAGSATAQIRRLAATLPLAGAPRLERLRGFADGFGRALTCACSRLILPDGEAAILIAATEPTGPNLTLGERVRRLFADDARTIAVFATDGTLLYAGAATRERLGGATTLAALGIEAIAAKALEDGSANAATRLGECSLDRLGEDSSRVLVLTLPASPSEPVCETPAMQPTAAAPPPITEAIAATETPLPQTSSDEPSASERRHPLRFVWQMDDAERFVIGSDEFVELVGPRTTAAFGRLWSEIAIELKLDPDNQVARAIATHETWSGITVSWPVDETSECLPVELSGLPVFDRDRSFRGYRGFGVCRDIARINQLTRARRERPIGFMPVSEAPAADSAGAAAAAISASEPDAGAEAAVSSPQPLSAPAQLERPAPNVAPAAANVVPFRPGPSADPKAPALSPVERKAFRELAQELTARLRGPQEAPALVERVGESAPAEELPAPADAAVAQAVAAPVALEPAPQTDTGLPAAGDSAAAAGPAALLDRVPVGVLVHRAQSPLYANRHFLELSGYDSVEALAAAGGLNSLFAEPEAGALAENGGAQTLSIMTRHGDKVVVDGRLFSIAWDGATALALIVTDGQAATARRTGEIALAAAASEIGELKSRLDRDAAVHEKTEDELRNARREAQKAAAAKSEFLSRVSHEIRTPLNAIAGFAEVIMAERFGPIGNERYREYLKDIHAAGTHLVSLLNDLLDLSKIETGQLDLAFASIPINDLIQQCVGIMQPQANRARIIIRTALTPVLPHVIADERSLRQIMLSLMGHSIRFTGPGGQVIVSSAFSESHDVVLRVRDTGAGMSESDIEAALEPFRQTTTSASWGSGGTGLGLPLTKALAEANRAHFSIKSAPNAGTLVEIAFPPSRVVAP